MYEQAVKTEEDDAFLANLLGEVDSNVPRPVRSEPRPNRVQDRRKARALSPATAGRKNPVPKRQKVEDKPSSPSAQDDASTPVLFADNLDMDFSDGNDDPCQALPSSPIANIMERKLQIKVKNEEEDEEDTMEVAQTTGITTTSINMTARRPPLKLKQNEPTRASEHQPANQQEATAWNPVTDKLNVLNSSQTLESSTLGKIDPSHVAEEDGSLRMFWTDYTEVNGNLCLFGKVLNKTTGTYVSCFVKVDNILRSLYFLPRPHKQGGGVDGKDEVRMEHVYAEVDSLMEKMKVTMHKIKACTRKYAFELVDIPKEAEYLKLRYPYSSKFFNSLAWPTLIHH